MTANVTTSVPDRTELRLDYDEAISELNPYRNNCLTTPFYSQTGNAVFDACCLALSDTAAGNKLMRTISCPPGAGKTSFAYAFLIALTRYAERHPNEPLGAVLVVNEIKKADNDFRSLHTHIPRHIAIWSKEHDRVHRVREKLQEEPIARFAQHELRNYAVAVVTHQFYLDVNGEHARTLVHHGKAAPRILTIIDEQPNEVPTKEITLAEAYAPGKGRLAEVSSRVKS